MYVRWPQHVDQTCHIRALAGLSVSTTPSLRLCDQWMVAPTAHPFGVSSWKGERYWLTFMNYLALEFCHCFFFSVCSVFKEVAT